MADERPFETSSPRHRSLRLFSVIAALAITGAVGCDRGGDTFPVELSWSFADSRPCDLAGVVEVEVIGEGRAPRRLHCADGLAPARFVLFEASPGEELTLEALSFGGAVLYRGTTTASGESPAAVTLRFVGGR